MHRITLDRHGRGIAPAVALIATLAILIPFFGVGTAHAVKLTAESQNGTGGHSGTGLVIGKPGTPAGFEIDGDLVGAAGNIDWFPGGGSGVIDPATCLANPQFLPAIFGRDGEWRLGIDGKFKTRSNKNNDNIAPAASPWNWSEKGGNPPKNDITELYAHSRKDGSGTTWLFFGVSTRAPQGDNHTDIEFNQAGLTITGEHEGLIIGNGPANGRTIGDLLVSVDEITGGKDPSLTVRRWNGTEFLLVPDAELAGKLYGAHNIVPVAAPCGAINRKGVKTDSYEPAQFIELGISTDLLLNPDFGSVCGRPSTVMVKTRSSHSFTAELKDFALASFESAPPPDCVITGPSTTCAGQTVQLCGPDGPGLNYLWSTGATTRCIDVTSQGKYTLTVSNGACEPITCTKQVLAGVEPDCTIKGPDRICEGQTAELCGPEGFESVGFSYLWSTGAKTRCITINGPGTYTLTVNTPNCGSATCSKTVEGGGTSVACSIAGPDALEPGDSGVLCGPDGPGLSYVWSTGETTRCITIPGPGTYTLTVNGEFCESSTCTKVVRDQSTSSCRCSFFYPDDSNLPRSAQAFHETALLRAVVPGRDGCPNDAVLKLWYNDESALGLGIRRVVVYTSDDDSTVTDYPVSPSPGAPSCVVSPQLGATAQTGDQTGNDTAVGGGRPIWPVLYLTDITFDKYARDGDWQQGSTTGIPADQVCGVWTTGVRRLYKHLGNQVTIQMDPSPAQNHWNLGAGSDVPPGGFGAYPDEGYGAEVSWNVASMGLVPGHRYRLYTMVHDGDQSNPDGGDVGHACTRVVMGQNAVLAMLDDDGTVKIDMDAGEYASKNPTALPARFELSANAPNPFSAGTRTTMRFALPERSQVRVGVYTVAGQRVATLVDGTFEAGQRTIAWDGRDGSGRTLAPGMYVCKLEASAATSGRFVQMRKMMMVR